MPLLPSESNQPGLPDDEARVMGYFGPFAAVRLAPPESSKALNNNSGATPTGHNPHRRSHDRNICRRPMDPSRRSHRVAPIPKDGVAAPVAISKVSSTASFLICTSGGCFLPLLDSKSKPRFDLHQSA